MPARFHAWIQEPSYSTALPGPCGALPAAHHSAHCMQPAACDCCSPPITESDASMFTCSSRSTTHAFGSARCPRGATPALAIMFRSAGHTPQRPTQPSTFLLINRNPLRRCSATRKLHAAQGRAGRGHLGAAEFHAIRAVTVAQLQDGVGLARRRRPASPASPLPCRHAQVIKGALCEYSWRPGLVGRHSGRRTPHAQGGSSCWGAPPVGGEPQPLRV